MDRRVVTAIVLMMAVAILPSVFFKPKPVPRTAAPQGGASPELVVDTLRPSPAAPADAAAPPPGSAAARAAATEEIVTVASPLYRFAFSTIGGRLVEATLNKYPSMRPGENRRPAQILRPTSDLLSL
ncbi:MAG TPA: hypothetical protein VF187_11125, partial [Gemmatimonadales bacterium]